MKRMKMVMALLSVVLMVTLLGCPNESSGGSNGNGDGDIVATYENLLGNWKSDTLSLTNPSDSSQSYTFYYLYKITETTIGSDEVVVTSTVPGVTPGGTTVLMATTAYTKKSEVDATVTISVPEGSHAGDFGFKFTNSAKTAFSYSGNNYTQTN